MKLAETFFGGVSQMRSRLAHALKEARERFGHTHAALDRICGLGLSADMPSSRDYEENHDLITERLVARVMFPLDLAIDEVFPVHFGRGARSRAEVVKYMKKTGAGLRAGGGGRRDAKNVSPESQAAVYVILKALKEMDDAPRAGLTSEASLKGTNRAIATTVSKSGRRGVQAG